VSCQNPDGSAPAPTVYVDANVPPGTYAYTIDAADAVGNRSPQSVAIQAVALARPAAAVAVHEPPTLPVSIITFPSRDFVSSFGWLASDQVNVELIREGKVISTSSGLIPLADPQALPGSLGFAGFVDVNQSRRGLLGRYHAEMRAGISSATPPTDPMVWCVRSSRRMSPVSRASASSSSRMTIPARS
jgi:hypothetical protein